MRLVRADGLECDESVLTGESLPVDKLSEPVGVVESPLALGSCAFMGTVVRNGSGVAVVVQTGARTEFFRSHPSKPLTFATLACVSIGAILPFSPVADPLGFVALPAAFFAFLVAMIVIYLRS